MFRCSWTQSMYIATRYFLCHNLCVGTKYVTSSQHSSAFNQGQVLRKQLLQRHSYIRTCVPWRKGREIFKCLLAGVFCVPVTQRQMFVLCAGYARIFAYRCVRVPVTKKSEKFLQTDVFCVPNTGGATNIFIGTCFVCLLGKGRPMFTCRCVLSARHARNTWGSTCTVRAPLVITDLYLQTLQGYKCLGRNLSKFLNFSGNSYYGFKENLYFVLRRPEFGKLLGFASHWPNG
jgi:hypothetical protein